MKTFSSRSQKQNQDFVKGHNRSSLKDIIHFFWINSFDSLQIVFDNSCHSGKVKLTLDFDEASSVCKNWKISGTGM